MLTFSVCENVYSDCLVLYSNLIYNQNGKANSWFIDNRQTEITRKWVKEMAAQ